MATLLDLLQESLQPAIDTILCGAPTLPNILLAVGAPPPQFVRDAPLIGALLTPATCTPTPVFVPPQFTGGQCDNLIYNVSLRTRRSDGSFLDQTIPNIQGPIRGVRNFWIPFPDPGGQPFPYWEIIAPNVTGPTPGFVQFGPLQSPPDSAYAAATWITNVVPSVPGPDACGNPSPVPIPPRGTEFGPFTLPPVSIDIPGFGPISFTGNITFRPSINLPILGGIHFPVTVNLNANAILSVPISFPLYLRFPSLEINGGISFTNNIDIGPSINFPRGGGDDCCDCEDIREIVQEELDEKFPPKRPIVSTSSSLPASQSGTIVLEPLTYRVDVVLDEIPTDAKVQWGVDAPDVYYAGWYSFGEGPNGGDRQPISYQRNTFFPPNLNCDNFTYTLRAGYTGTVTVYRYQE